MGPLVSVAVIVAGMAATTTLLVLGVMALRHPRLPARLQTDGVAQAACFFLTAVLAGTISAGIAGLGYLDVPINGYGAVALTVGIILATTYLLCVLAHVGERLRRADAGCSPFAALPRAEHGIRLGRLSPH